MSPPNVTLSQLSQPAQMLLKSRRTESSLSPAEWSKVFQEVCAFEHCNDARRRTAGFVLLAMIVGLIPAIIVGFAVFPPSGIGLVPLVLFGAVAAGIRYHRMQQLDLGPHFRQSFAPLFDILRDDLHPSKPVQLRLDLRGMSKDKIVRQGKIDPKGNPRIKSLTETVYEDPWCTLRAQMTGGHRLQLTLVTRAFKNSRYYRSQSGKYKTKVKWKKVVTVAAAVTPSPDRLAIDPSSLKGLEAHGKCTVQQRRRGETVRLSKKFKSKASDCLERPIVPAKVLEVLFALCRSLVPKGNSNDAA